MKEERRNNKVLLIGLILFGLGIWILLAPGQVLRLMGIAALLQGGLMLYRYNKSEEKATLRAKGLLFVSVVLLIIGILFVLRIGFVVMLFAYIVAVAFLIDAVQNIKLAFTVKNENPLAFIAALALNALVIAAAVILLINPMVLGMTVAAVVGITLLFIGAEYAYMGFKKIK